MLNITSARILLPVSPFTHSIAAVHRVAAMTITRVAFWHQRYDAWEMCDNATVHTGQFDPKSFKNLEWLPIGMFLDTLIISLKESVVSDWLFGALFKFIGFSFALLARNNKDSNIT